MAKIGSSKSSLIIQWIRVGIRNILFQILFMLRDLGALKNELSNEKTISAI